MDADRIATIRAIVEHAKNERAIPHSYTDHYAKDVPELCDALVAAQAENTQLQKILAEYGSPAEEAIASARRFNAVVTERNDARDERDRLASQVTDLTAEMERVAEAGAIGIETMTKEVVRLQGEKTELIDALDNAWYGLHQWNDFGGTTYPPSRERSQRWVDETREVLARLSPTEEPRS